MSDKGTFSSSAPFGVRAPEWALNLERLCRSEGKVENPTGSLIEKPSEGFEGFTGTPHPAGASCEQSSLTKGAVKPRSSLDVVHADDLRSVKSTDDDWIQKTRDTCKVNGLVLFRTLYWYLDEYSCVLVPRNRFWFEAALPKIKSVWDTIVKERTDGYEHRAPKKKALKNTIVTADTSGNTYQIENLNFNKSICLVKLD